MAERTSKRFDVIGESPKRTEGLQFLNGDARYTSDLDAERMLHGAFVRSPHAHADIESVDTSTAEAMDGVHAVLTGEGVTERTIPKGNFIQRKSRGDQYALAHDRVRYAGEPVAVVAAEDKYLAQDAADSITVKYSRREPILDADEALEDDAELIHPEMQDVEYVEGNRSDTHTVQAGDTEAAFAEADHVVEETFRSEYFNATPMETHGSLANWDASNERLEIWDSTQSPHKVKDLLSHVLGLTASKVRVYKPEVGGGFGNKASIYPHEVLAPLLSMDTGRPVKIILDRTEEIKTTTSCFLYHIDGRLAVTEDGTVTAIEMDILHDEGAYHSWGTAIMGLAMSGPSMLPYKIPNVALDGQVVYTNKVPAAPVRGTGLRQLTLARERMMTKAADTIGMDQLEFRKENYIREDECPYKTAKGDFVDSAGIERATETIEEDYRELLEEAEDDPNKGIGVGALMEWSSCRHGRFDTDYESAVVRMEEDGTVRIQSSSADMGTGTRTTLAQVCSEQLGVDVEDINVIEGDTDATPPGLGSWGSRTMVVTGTAIYNAVQEIRERIFDIAAHNLEAAPEDLSIADGQVQVQGAPDRNLSLAEISKASHYDKGKLPDGMSPGALLGKASFDTGDDSLETPSNIPDENGHANMSMTYSSGVQVVLTEVDPETGRVEIERYIVGDDVGKAVNPDIVEGQIQGGVGQGVSVALGEELVYNDNGQLLTDNFSSYPIRTSADIPHIEDNIVEVPSMNTPGGWKGVGEAGLTVAIATIANSVSDAINADINEMPMTPANVYEKLSE